MQISWKSRTRFKIKQLEKQDRIALGSSAQKIYDLNNTSIQVNMSSAVITLSLYVSLTKMVKLLTDPGWAKTSSGSVSHGQERKAI